MKDKSVIIVVILIILLGSILIVNILNDERVYSIITLDSLPSIKLKLNKKNKVLDVEKLNKESDIIDKKEIIGDEINDALDTILKKFKEAGYFDEDSTLLVNIETAIKGFTEVVENEIKDKTKDDNIDVVTQTAKVTDEIKKIAEKYNITESKAYYVNEQAKEQSKKIEDLMKEVNEQIEKTKAEIDKIKEEQEKMEEEFSKQKDQNYEKYKSEGMMDIVQLKPIFFEKYNIPEGTNIFERKFDYTSDSRCKYNKAVSIEIIEGFYKHSAIMCQFNGDTYDYKKVKLVESTINSDEAYKKALDKCVSEKKINSNEITNKQVLLTYSGMSEYKYIYSVSIFTKSGGHCSAVINAVNGNIIQVF